ncbi:hypothetical protein GALMADRAFT_159131 [Galerina marginata CBS 339.88]|uniref:Uncharacterized protein n=1 Tax=Galerina marginata (strain CBS 339.88) TaxID=685588 RepID=A0A067SMI6_GALM3|nr:hypothetical protein GALMADRAFT_159131 [Galerina marginata CBS 339.88]
MTSEGLQTSPADRRLVGPGFRANRVGRGNGRGAHQQRSDVVDLVLNHHTTSPLSVPTPNGAVNLGLSTSRRHRFDVARPSLPPGCGPTQEGSRSGLRGQDAQGEALEEGDPSINSSTYSIHPDCAGRTRTTFNIAFLRLWCTQRRRRLSTPTSTGSFASTARPPNPSCFNNDDAA